MDGASIIQFKTKMDVNGNSRRCFAYIEHGLLLGVWRDQLPRMPRIVEAGNAGLTIEVTPSQFRSLCKQGESLLYSGNVVND